MKRIITLLITLTIVNCFSQKGPGLFVNNDGKKNTLGIQNLNVKTEILEGVARTTFDFTFFNNYSRILEGEFLFPLPQGAVVSGFSLEINGKLRPAVIVEKELGRKAYENTIRRQIDPALVEKTRGNNYRTRVYPIPAKGTKRLTLTYEQTLEDNGDEYVYRLPIVFDDIIQELSVDIEVLNSKTVPTIKRNNVGLSFEPWQNIFRASTQKSKYKSKEDIYINIPKMDGSKVVANEEGYFMASGFINELKYTSPAAKVYDKITILWDASMSRHKEKLEKEYKFLEAFFAKNPNVDVELIKFSNYPEQPENHKIVSGNWSDLKSSLLKTIYDGATNFYALQNVCKERSVFMFTDGLENFGYLNTLTFGNQAFVLSSSNRSDYDVLEYLGTTSGGAYINLSKTSVDDAVKMVDGTQLQFLGVKSNANECFPQVPTLVTNDFSLCGVKPSSNTIELSYGFAGREAFTHTLSIVGAKELQTELITNQWAKSKIKHLILDKNRNRSEIIKVSQRFGLVTDFTSLIVLDRLEDYLRYKIVPPSELQEAYFARVQLDSTNKKDEYKKHMERVVSMFKSRQNWYQKDFVKVDVPKKQEVKSSQDESAIDQYIVIADSSKGALIGVVRESKTDSVLVRATVFLDKTTFGTRTNEQGYFEIKDIPVGEYTLIVNYPRKSLKTTQQVSISPREVKTINVALSEQVKRIPNSSRTSLSSMVKKETSAVQVNEKKSETRVVGNISAEQMSSQGRVSFSDEEEEEEEDEEAMEEVIDLGIYEDVSATPMESRGQSSVASAVQTHPSSNSQKKGTIQVQGWNPDTPYMSIMLSQDTSAYYSTYLTIRDGYNKVPSFYLDIADLFFQKNMVDKGLKILSNVAELKIDDYRLLRVLGYKLNEFNQPDLAVPVFKKIVELRGEEPQSYRDLGLAYAQVDSLAQAKENLYRVVETPWNGRFPGIELIALGELNHLLNQNPEISRKGINRKLLDEMVFDLRIVLSWDADNCDMDLWIIEPTKEKCDYSHRNTRKGGQMSHDFRRGYGPEEYMVKKSVEGTYKIKVDYFGNSAQTITGPVTIQVKVISNYGTEFEQEKVLTRRLENRKEIISIGEISF